MLWLCIVPGSCPGYRSTLNLKSISRWFDSPAMSKNLPPWVPVCERAARRSTQTRPSSALSPDLTRVGSRVFFEDQDKLSFEEIVDY
jgi:hypothetical protein